MGNCLSPSSQHPNMSQGHIKQSEPQTTPHQTRTSVKLIHPDGTLQEVDRPIRASEVLSGRPDCFLCCAESMFIGSAVPRVGRDDELQLGQIYFLLPALKSKVPLSLQEMCGLAIRANAALRGSVKHKLSKVVGSW